MRKFNKRSKKKKRKELVRMLAERDILIDSLQQDVAELIERPLSYKSSIITGGFYIKKSLEKAIWFGDATNIPKV